MTTNVGFSASGNCLTNFSYDNNQIGTATFSATSTGSTYLEAVDTLKNVLNSLVSDFYTSNPSYTKISVIYYDVNCVPSTDPKLTLYYNIIFENGNIVNQVRINYVTEPIYTYTGASDQRMTNSLYQPNSDIISYFGFRTPASAALILPPLYNETVSILQPDTGSFISAQKIYVDSGSAGPTTVPFTTFDVTCASGIFSNYSLLKIVYDNSDPNDFKRQVEFY